MSDRYTFDPRQSRLTAQAFSGGVLRAFAHNPTLAARDFSGDFAFTPDGDSIRDVSVRVTAKAASFEVTDDMSAKDKQEIANVAHDQVLSASRFPDIRFESADAAATKVYGNTYSVKLNGTLTLRGIAKPHSVELQANLLDGSIRLSGGSTVKQSEFNIKPVKAAGGMIATKDEVKVAFDIVARREEPA